MRGYLGMTVHFVSNDCSLHYKLASPRFTGPHTAEEIVKLAMEVIESYDIRDKIRFVGTDNGGNIVKAFKDWMPGFPEPLYGSEWKPVLPLMYSKQMYPHSGNSASFLYRRVRQWKIILAYSTMTLRKTTGRKLRDRGRDRY